MIIIQFSDQIALSLHPQTFSTAHALYSCKSVVLFLKYGWFELYILITWKFATLEKYNLQGSNSLRIEKERSQKDNIYFISFITWPIPRDVQHSAKNEVVYITTIDILYSVEYNFVW